MRQALVSEFLHFLVSIVEARICQVFVAPSMALHGSKVSTYIFIYIKTGNVNVNIRYIINILIIYDIYIVTFLTYLTINLSSSKETTQQP